MKIATIILACAIAASIVLFIILGVMSRSGQAPGLVDGKLAKCPDKPNCVCSEQKDDVKHYIAPIIISSNESVDTLPVLKNTIRDMGGSISAESNNYIASTFKSSFFGFVDDFEIRVDTINNIIHIRSAAKVGYSDMGVNKKRAEVFRQQYRNKITKAVQSLQ